MYWYGTEAPLRISISVTDMYDTASVIVTASSIAFAENETNNMTTTTTTTTATTTAIFPS